MTTIGHQPGGNDDTVPATASIVPAFRTRVPPPAATEAGSVVPVWTIERGSQSATLPVTAAVPSAAETVNEAGDGAHGPSFELVRPVGRGGMGEVWEARQRSLKRTVAVKTIRGDAWRQLEAEPTEQVRQRKAFEQEAYIAALLDHPNIVPVYDLGRAGENGPPLLAMKLVTGESWVAVLEEDSVVLGADEFLARHLPILASVTQAVSFAHSRGIVHRDLKPGQVMLGEFGETLLTDWGLGILVGADGGAAGTLHAAQAPFLPTPITATSPAGTPAMMAPEQAMDTAEGIGTWTDVYLLGGMLYYLLTGGTYPHPAKSSIKAMEQARAGMVEAPSVRAAFRPIPADLEALCMRALSKEPSERVPSAAAFLDALNDHMTGAGRRRESAGLAAQAAAAFGELTGQSPAPAPLAVYSGHSLVENLAGRALELWPANAEARSLRERNLAARADAEAGHGDLLLARVHLEELRGMRPRGAGDVTMLEERIARAERKRDAHRRQRLGFAAAAAVLFLCAISFALISQANAAKARRSLAAALEQGEGSQQLVLYVFKDLKGELERQTAAAASLAPDAANRIKHGVGDAVGARILDYFTGLNPADWPVDLRLELASNILDVSQAFTMWEDFARAARMLSLSDDIITGAGSLSAPLRGRQLLRTADLLVAQGSFKEALAMAGDAEEQFARQGTGGGSAGMECTTLLGIIHRHLGDLEKAEEYARSVYDWHAAHPETHSDPQSAASPALNLAAIMNDMDRFEEAEKLYGEALRLAEGEAAGAGDVAVLVRNSLARLYHRTGRRQEAVEQYEMLLQAVERELGPDTPSASLILMNLASTLATVDRYEDAMAHAGRAIDIRSRVFGSGSVQAAEAMSKACLIANMHRDSPRACELGEKALDIRLVQLGPDDPATVRARIELASAYYVAGDFGRAEEQLAVAVQACDRTHGAESPVTGDVLRDLAAMRMHLVDFAGAQRALVRSLAICEATDGASGPEWTRRAGMLASVLESLGQTSEAAGLRARLAAVKGGSGEAVDE